MVGAHVDDFFWGGNEIFTDDINSPIKYDRALCIFRTKKDFILRGRRSATKEIDISLSDSEYADYTAVLFDSKETLETFSSLLIIHFEKFGMEFHVSHCDQTNKPSKTEVSFVSAPRFCYTEH